MAGVESGWSLVQGRVASLFGRVSDELVAWKRQAASRANLKVEETIESEGICVVVAERPEPSPRFADEMEVIGDGM